MDNAPHVPQPTPVEAGIKEMHIKNEPLFGEPAGRIRTIETKEKRETHSPKTPRTKSSMHSPLNSGRSWSPPDMKNQDNEKVVGGEVVVKMEPGHPPKLARTASRKFIARPAPLFDHYENKTEESTASFEVIPACIYMYKHIGSTEHAMECDCTEEWGKPIGNVCLHE